MREYYIIDLVSLYIREKYNFTSPAEWLFILQINFVHYLFFYTYKKRVCILYLLLCKTRSTICNLPREHISHTMCMNVSIYIPVYICIYTFLQKRENNARLSHIFLLRCSFAEIDSEVRWVTDVHRFRN